MNENPHNTKKIVKVSLWIVLSLVLLLLLLTLCYILFLHPLDKPERTDNKQMSETLIESVLETIVEETVVDEIALETESDENGSCPGAYVEYGQEYLGNWYSEDGHINFTVDKLFTAAGNGYTPGKYVVNDNTYDVIVDIVPYHTESKYDGYVLIYISIPIDNITNDSEPIISGVYKMSSDENVISVTVQEVDIDGWSPTYENTRSVYHVGDVVVFNKQ